MERKSELPADELRGTLRVGPAEILGELSRRLEDGAGYKNGASASPARAATRHSTYQNQPPVKLRGVM